MTGLPGMPASDAAPSTEPMKPSSSLPELGAGRIIRGRELPSTALALGAGAVGGLANALAFPGAGWWPLALVGTPLLLAVTANARFRVAIAASAVGGAVFWGVHIFWLTVYLGPLPWLALASLQAAFFVVGAVLTAVIWRLFDGRAGAGRFIVLPALVASIWSARELLTSVWPYGGFGWGRLAYSQSESPLADLAAWVGVTGISFLIVAVSALTVQVIRHRGGPGRMVTPAVLLIGLAIAPSFPVPTTGAIRVGGVQGNSEAGLLAKNRPGSILEDHLQAADALRGEPLDFLVLPENAVDLNPLERPEAAMAIDDLSASVGAPVVLGTITQSSGKMFNSTIVWNGGVGATDQYDKKHPVPFAEYLPDRHFWYPLAPDLFSLIPRDFAVGERDNVVDVGEVRAGVAICYDIVDDALIRDMVAGGAQVILAPTNNADFGRSDQSAQQLAIARVRAVEAGRSIVNISTVGASAIFGPNGRTINRLPAFLPGAMVAQVPLATATTPAMLVGPVVDAGVLGTGAFSVIGAWVLAWRARRGFPDLSPSDGVVTRPSERAVRSGRRRQPKRFANQA